MVIDHWSTFTLESPVWSSHRQKCCPLDVSQHITFAFYWHLSRLNSGNYGIFSSNILIFLISNKIYTPSKYQLKKQAHVLVTDRQTFMNPGLNLKIRIGGDYNRSNNWIEKSIQHASTLKKFMTNTYEPHLFTLNKNYRELIWTKEFFGG